MYLWQQIQFCCQIYIQPNIFNKYTSTVFLPVVKMAMSRYYRQIIFREGLRRLVEEGFPSRCQLPLKSDRQNEVEMILSKLYFFWIRWIRTGYYPCCKAMCPLDTFYSDINSYDKRYSRYLHISYQYDLHINQPVIL